MTPRKYDFEILAAWRNATKGSANDFCERYLARYICLQRETRQFIGEALHPGEPYMRKMLDNLAGVLMYAPYAPERYDLFSTFDALLARIMEKWDDVAAPALGVRAAWHEVGKILDDDFEAKTLSIQWNARHGDEFAKCCEDLKNTLAELSRALLTPATGVDTPEQLSRLEIKMEEIAAGVDHVNDRVETVGEDTAFLRNQKSERETKQRAAGKAARQKQLAETGRGIEYRKALAMEIAGAIDRWEDKHGKLGRGDIKSITAAVIEGWKQNTKLPREKRLFANEFNREKKLNSLMRDVRTIRAGRKTV